MKYLPSEIEINGVTYYSGLELASRELDSYNLGVAVGKKEGYDAGMDEGYKSGYANGLDNGKQEGYDEGYKKGYDAGYNDGYKEGKERRSPYLVAPVSEYPNPYNVGYEAGKTEATLEKVDQFNKGYEIGKYEGYEAGKKANGISKKEIPGEYLAHIEEARLEGYKEGYSDAKEGGYAEGYSDDYCKDCKEEPGRDDDDGEPIDDNQSEYDKGYYAGWEDGKNHIMQYI